MSIKLSETQPFVITLDTLDTQYIHSHMFESKMGDVRPIWSKTSLNREKEYFEFQLMAVNRIEEKSPCIDDLKKFLCHVCNIQVPIVFLKDHYDSEKHKTFKKLIKKVLNRVGKSINMCTEDTNAKIHDNIYYCLTCSEAILKNNKLTHDISEEHLKSLRYDALMNDFLNLYMNKDAKTMNLSNDCDDVMMNSCNDNEVENFAGDKNVKLKNGIGDVNNRESHTASVKLDNDIKMININHDVVSKMNRSNEISDGNVINFSRDYCDKEMNVNIYGIRKPKTGNTSKVKVITTDSVASLENPVAGSSNQNITSKNDNDKLAKLKVSNDKNVKTGNDTKLTTPKNDNNVMNLKNDSTIKNAKSVNDIKLATPKQDTNGMNLNTDMKLYSKIVKDGNSSNKEINENPKIQQIPLIDGEPVVLWTQHGDTVVPINNYHGLISTDGGIFCNLCLIYVEGSTKSHVEKEKHVSMVVKPIDKYFIREINGILNHCIVCNTVLPNCNETHAIENETHKNLLKSFTKVYPTEQADKTYCSTCDKHIHTHNYISHIQSKKHLQLRSNLPQNNDIASLYTRITANPKERLCFICKVIIPNTEKHISEHFKATKHKNNLAIFIKNNKIKMIAEDYFYCETCIIDFNDIVEHVNKNSHKNNVLTQNKDTNDTQSVASNDTDKTPYEFCDVCKVKLPLRGKLVHEAGRSHRDKLSKLFPTTDVNSEKQPTPNSGNDKSVNKDTQLKCVNDKSDDKTLKNDTPKLNNDSVKLKNYALDGFMELTEKNVLLCKICKTTVTNCEAHVEEHVKGKKHVNNLKLLINMLSQNSQDN